MEPLKITIQEKKVFDFLNQLRASGEINMYEAPKHLTIHFGYDFTEGVELTKKWMDNFNASGYEHLV